MGDVRALFAAHADFPVICSRSTLRVSDKLLDEINRGSTPNKKECAKHVHGRWAQREVRGYPPPFFPRY